jgi:hypothetical protein
MSKKIQKGLEVTINVPFTYTIGEEGFKTGKILETIEDCKAEAEAELLDGLTGDISMTVEVEPTDKEYNIARIKEVIREWGETTSAELELDASPCLSSVGNSPNRSELIERFGLDGVEVVTYVGETEVDENFVNYEDLPEDIITEIRDIMEDYDTDQFKTMQRCED